MLATVPQAAEQVAYSLAVDRALHRAKVGCAWSATRRLLNGNSVADRLDGGYEGNRQERRKESEELAVRNQVEATPLGSIRDADPGGVEYALNIAQPNAAPLPSLCDCNQRRPLLQVARRAQGQRHHGDER